MIFRHLCTVTSSITRLGAPFNVKQTKPGVCTLEETANLLIGLSFKEFICIPDFLYIWTNTPLSDQKRGPRGVRGWATRPEFRIVVKQILFLNPGKSGIGPIFNTRTGLAAFSVRARARSHNYMILSTPPPPPPLKAGEGLHSC